MMFTKAVNSVDIIGAVTENTVPTIYMFVLLLIFIYSDRLQ